MVRRDRSDHVVPSAGARFHRPRQIIKFDGCYHGHVDAACENGHGALTRRRPDSAVCRGIVDLTISLPFNDASLCARVSQNKNEIAAVLLADRKRGPLFHARIFWRFCVKNAQNRVRF